VDGDDRVARIVLAAEERLFLETVEPASEASPTSSSRSAASLVSSS
jgi:hypothetical protein